MFDSIIPKSKILSICLVACFVCLYSTAFCIPFYFIPREIAGVYFLCLYLGVPFSIGVVTTLAVSFHKKESFVVNIVYSQLVLLLLIVGLFFSPLNYGYGTAFLTISVPFFIFFTFIGTAIGDLIQEK